MTFVAISYINSVLKFGQFTQSLFEGAMGCIGGQTATNSGILQEFRISDPVLHEPVTEEG